MTPDAHPRTVAGKWPSGCTKLSREGLRAEVLKHIPNASVVMPTSPPVYSPPPRPTRSPRSPRSPRLPPVRPEFKLGHQTPRKGRAADALEALMARAEADYASALEAFEAFEADHQAEEQAEEQAEQQAEEQAWALELRKHEQRYRQRLDVGTEPLLDLSRGVYVEFQAQTQWERERGVRLQDNPDGARLFFDWLFQSVDAKAVYIGARADLHYWRYKDRYYSTADPLTPEDVTALVDFQEAKKQRTLDRAHLSASNAAGTRRLGRPVIPDDVKMFVWQRDGGRCVQCDSNENLEFDHIIPVTMGGANTARNLQLLCEPCNRAKGGNLV